MNLEFPFASQMLKNVDFYCILHVKIEDIA
jgi:hypothetical protein